MSTAPAYFPGVLSLQSRRTLALPAITILCLAIAVVCGGLVFAVLYNFDQHYPVAAVRSQASQKPVLVSSAIPETARIPAKTELQQPEPVARTHSELLALERLGQRNYVEFSITRSGGFHPVGPMEISFLHSDVRHASVQVSLYLNQHRIDFKHLKLDERVSIPTTHSKTLDLVVNGMTKNQITGYLSEPKNAELN